MAYSFTAASSQNFYSTAYNNGINPTTHPLTMACWIYVESITTNQFYFTIQNTAGNEEYRLGCQGNLAGDPIRFSIVGLVGGVATQYNTDINLPAANTWVHICGVASAANNRNLYVNGTAGTANTTSYTPSTINTLSISGAITTTSSPGYINYASGRVADAGIWNVALNADEITALSKGVSCSLIRPTALTFHAPLISNISDIRGGLTLSTSVSSPTVIQHPRIYI